MTIQTRNIDATIKYLEDILDLTAPHSHFAVDDRWPNERGLYFTHATEDKVLDIQIEVGMGTDAHPLVAAARVIATWLTTPNRCAHDWTEWSYAVSPTGRRRCKNCGEIDID